MVTLFRGKGRGEQDASGEILGGFFNGNAPVMPAQADVALFNFHLVVPRLTIPQRQAARLSCRTHANLQSFCAYPWLNERIT
jgi:hypothetical protein